MPGETAILLCHPIYIHLWGDFIFRCTVSFRTKRLRVFQLNFWGDINATGLRSQHNTNLLLSNGRGKNERLDTRFFYNPLLLIIMNVSSSINYTFLCTSPGHPTPYALYITAPFTSEEVHISLWTQIFTFSPIFSNFLFPFQHFILLSVLLTGAGWIEFASVYFIFLLVPLEDRNKKESFQLGVLFHHWLQDKLYLYL